jgi:hypothetical protein
MIAELRGYLFATSTKFKEGGVQMSKGSQENEKQNESKLTPKTKKLLIRILGYVLTALLEYWGQNSDSSRPCPATPQDKSGSS